LQEYIDAGAILAIIVLNAALGFFEAFLFDGLSALRREACQTAPAPVKVGTRAAHAASR
jgi:hypothetical protein